MSASPGSGAGGPARIVLFSTVYPPFVAEDEKMLLRHYDLRTVIRSGPGALVALLFAIARCDLVLTWFGSVYSAMNTLLAHMLHKPSVVVIGGVDAAREREIGYGIWLSSWRVPMLRYAFRKADRLLVVDPSLGEAAKKLAAYEGRNITYLPTGYDAAEWPPGSGERDAVVLTVASCDTPLRLRVKGIDVLMEAAQQMPGVRFRLIGVERRLLDDLPGGVPGNVEVLPLLPRRRLAAEYARAKVYCQPSFTEGLPNTLCEAMLCGCIPVGTIVGGIPTAIGQTGFLVRRGDISGLMDAIRTAMISPEAKGREARQRIIADFGLENRERGLCDVIEGLLDRTA